MNNRFELPVRYKNELFFQGEEIELSASMEKGDLFTPYFQPEFRSQQHNLLPPWEEIDHWLPVLKNEWDILNESLIAGYDTKSSAVLDDMIKGFSLFFMMLYWSNGKPVDVNSWKTSSQQLDITCLNLIERLNFVIQNADSYFARIQLNELILEIYKKSIKNSAINALKKKKSRE
ncbi:YpoC family protein [Jeotgalibacillus proteolyticus]|uniref:YpoC family protein n=1 Tax=Jeotgalibacillus proteolyticus TaxID=2082395 RepID=UPI003CFB80AE